MYEDTFEDDDGESQVPSITHARTAPPSTGGNNTSQTASVSHSATTSQLFAPPPLTPLSLIGYGERTKNKLLTKALAEEIRHLLPLRLQLYDTWRLCYSLEQHGVSLQTLYMMSAPPRTASRPGYVLIVEDKLGGIFGAYMNEYPHPSRNGRYYGNGECFLWKSKLIVSSLPGSENASTTSLSGSVSDSASTKSVNIQFKAFPYTGVNDYMILCDSHYVSVGGGDGKYGLYIDDRFEKGLSSSCPAFGNEPLSDAGQKFDIVGVEVWRISNF
ncbi:TLD-domain-containing protein [Lipomyces arxii]|uniref:TLD-domain-containing protein n=1 Tax=Lipomyces arxii TaxID=56418 RepID=UPI0034CF279D